MTKLVCPELCQNGLGGVNVPKKLEIEKFRTEYLRENTQEQGGQMGSIHEKNIKGRKF